MTTLKEISCIYNRKDTVLDKIDLSIAPGNIYGLLGKNGEGKSTLLKLISGLLFPDNGTCNVSGETPSKRNVSFLSNIFYLPEDIVLPDVTPETYLKMYAPFYPSFSKEIMNRCIELFELPLSAPIRKMSLGQKKKVAITMALSVNTPLLLMDEPTNGLDIPSKSVFRKLVASLMTDDRTIILSTHQVRDLESLIDAVIILDNQKIVLSDTLNTISEKLYFGKVEKADDVLYSESTMLGNAGVMVNKNKMDSVVSLELLFNATINHPQEIKKIFA